LILVDSSVWIDFFSSSPGRAGHELRRMIQESEPFALTGVVVAEVFEGLIRNADRIERFLGQWELLEPKGFQTYRTAAAIYRGARGKGMSLRTIDTLIAAIALEYDATVFTLDHDFSRIALITRLVLHRF
jgi:predicted nucleic acid-binding protein